MNFLLLSIGELNRIVSPNPENRKIDKRHVAELKKEMASSLEAFPPITINSLTNHIVDGAHRLQAFTELVQEGVFPKTQTYPVGFTTIPVEKETETIINANIHTRKWQLNDYIQSFCHTNDEYKKLDKWAKEHTLTVNEKGKPMYRYAAAFLKGRNSSSELKNKTFVISEDDYNKGEQRYNEIASILSITGKSLKNGGLEYMITAWEDINTAHSEIPFEKWENGFKYKAKSVPFQAMPYQSKKDWTNIFNTVYEFITRQ